jgi:DNA-3-methyladenine glycosylase
MNNTQLTTAFFNRDVLHVAPELIGKVLVRKFDNGEEKRYIITETEAYRGEEDLACHASKGRTKRTEIMYNRGGTVYVYFIYGMYWLLNFVTSEKDFPAAVLIRGLEGISGPGRIGKQLQLDGSFYGEDLSSSTRLWVEDAGLSPEINFSTRIGVAYAGDVWSNKPWRYILHKV